MKTTVEQWNLDWFDRVTKIRFNQETTNDQIDISTFVHLTEIRHGQWIENSISNTLPADQKFQLLDNEVAEKVRSEFSPCQLKVATEMNAAFQNEFAVRIDSGIGCCKPSK
ncbi:MAG: hypothetical protein AAF939_06305 [Planctomycetota bacterium]